MRTLLRALAAIVLTATAASAQSTTWTGSVSALVDHLPNLPLPGRVVPDATRAVTELRLRLMLDTQIDPRRWLRLRLAGVADGLVADRSGGGRDAHADALEAWIEVAGARADLRVGVGRLAWGRLDEVQPTDVINPIDVAKFLLEGRSEARLAVPLVRARWLGGETIRLEGVLVPAFRAGTFDRLDEPTSPFNLLLDLPGPACPPGVPCPARWAFARESPGSGAMQGGARMSATTGRVDWSVSGWNGFVPFGLISGVSPSNPAALRLVHPRYAMLGADVETVIGQWALRAEAAYFPDRPMQVSNQPSLFEGNSLEAGAGVDRRAGDFTLSGTVLLRREDTLTQEASNLMRGDVRTSVSVVAGFSRTFNRDRVETRLFSLVNPGDRAAFVRGVLAWKPADDVAIETSAGWFAGEGDDVITRFGDRDFAYLRLKYYFGR
ncbi:MAG: hypothetical protein M3Q55_18105 [Acidobacteriota bacterium]|nr:hypothetical protein [Acidobacteriota bacterium]